MLTSSSIAWSDDPPLIIDVDGPKVISPVIEHDQPPTTGTSLEDGEDDFVDEDDDGFEFSEDCNDQDVNTNPHAPEVCSDNIDNNCDDQVDEGCENNVSEPITEEAGEEEKNNEELVDAAEIPEGDGFDPQDGLAVGGTGNGMTGTGCSINASAELNSVAFGGMWMLTLGAYFLQRKKH